jgi:hypothetical protein
MTGMTWVEVSHAVSQFFDHAEAAFPVAANGLHALRKLVTVFICINRGFR